MRLHPRAWGSVGPSGKRRSNPSLMAGWKPGARTLTTRQMLPLEHAFRLSARGRKPSGWSGSTAASTEQVFIRSSADYDYGEGSGLSAELLGSPVDRRVARRAACARHG